MKSSVVFRELISLSLYFLSAFLLYILKLCFKCIKIHDCYIFLVDVLFKYMEYMFLIKSFALKSIFYDCDIPDCFWYMPCISFSINSFSRFLCDLILSVSIEQQHIDDYFLFLFPPLPSLPTTLPFFPNNLSVSVLINQLNLFVFALVLSIFGLIFYHLILCFLLPLFPLCLSYSIDMGFCPFFL